MPHSDVRIVLRRLDFPVPDLLFVRFVAAPGEAPRHQASTRLRSGDLHFPVRTPWNAADETSDACKNVVESSDDLGPTMIE
jgi:hypothetical protein